MKFQDVARFEYRRFGGDLARFKDIFAALAPANVQSPSRETYIVTRLNVESNVKIRSHRLQVKGLQGRLHGLEQWQPVLDLAFPVTADAIENVMAPALGIDLDLGGATAFSDAALLQLAADKPALATIVVEKARTLFDLGDCEAEYCELSLGAGQLQTIAVEAVDAEAERSVLRRLDLDAAENESYAAFLHKRLFPVP